MAEKQPSAPASPEKRTRIVRAKGHHLFGTQALGDGDVAELPEDVANRAITGGHAETATAKDLEEHAVRVAEETATAKRKPETRGGK